MAVSKKVPGSRVRLIKKQTKTTAISKSQKKGIPSSRARPNKKQAKSKSKATSKTSKQNRRTTAPSRLLSLAPELRNVIFRYAVVSDEPIKIQFKSNRHDNRYHFAMVPGLTMACKQTRLETQLSFWKRTASR